MRPIVLAVATVLATGPGGGIGAQTAESADRPARAVADRIRQIEARDVARWRRIAWTGSLVEARAASRREGRPVFLLVYDGNIDTGRC